MYDFEGDYETVYNGQKHGLKNIGLIEKYRGSTKIPQWESPCGDVTGASDGTKFPGYIKPNDTLLFYRKSMCRAKKLVSSLRSIMSIIFLQKYETRTCLHHIFRAEINRLYYMLITILSIK